jgi:hypothetical protein
MKDFLKKISSFIVDEPDKIEIKEASENGLDIFTIVAPEDQIGKIIGKGGKVINSIRCLARLKAIKNNRRILIKVESAQMENGLSRPTSTEGNSSEELTA